MISATLGYFATTKKVVVLAAKQQSKTLTTGLMALNWDHPILGQNYQSKNYVLTVTLLSSVCVL